MNKEELEQAFNETTNNAVKIINDYKELIVRYNIMKENAEKLAKRIDKAIEYINTRTLRMETLNYQISDLTKKELLNILKGSDKE